jgi:hypothetical protein
VGRSLNGGHLLLMTTGVTLVVIGTSAAFAAAAGFCAVCVGLPLVKSCR